MEKKEEEEQQEREEVPTTLDSYLWIHRWIALSILKTLDHYRNIDRDLSSNHQNRTQFNAVFVQNKEVDHGGI